MPRELAPPKPLINIFDGEKNPKITFEPLKSLIFSASLSLPFEPFKLNSRKHISLQAYTALFNAGERRRRRRTQGRCVKLAENSMKIKQLFERKRDCEDNKQVFKCKDKQKRNRNLKAKSCEESQ